nr:glycoside hydrolase family 88 protein [Ereboglobus luteus]
MSVPFLVRYYQLTNERKYIDDAARQFIGFKKHLYIPRLRLMSHVYDFMRGKATGIPWGRGNGWVLFSLSELLAVLPEKHKLRPQLLDFSANSARASLRSRTPRACSTRLSMSTIPIPKPRARRCSCMDFRAACGMAGIRIPRLHPRRIQGVGGDQQKLDRQIRQCARCLPGLGILVQSEYYKRDLL